MLKVVTNETCVNLSCRIYHKTSSGKGRDGKNRFLFKANTILMRWLTGKNLHSSEIAKKSHKSIAYMRRGLDESAKTRSGRKHFD